MNEFIEFSKLLAQQSQNIILDYYNRNSLEIDFKSDHSPVTLADRESEKIMREMIHRHFPDHGIRGEEFGVENNNAEYVWVLDPIDGTKSFINHIPLFGTLIALLKNQTPILGIINLPVQNELIIGVKDQPTRLNDQILKPQSVDQLDQALLLCTDIKDAYIHQNGQAMTDLIKKVRLFRTWGDCFMYAQLVRGYGDIVVDAIMNDWDIQALIPIVEGVGYKITDYQGEDAKSANSIVAASPSIHSKVIEFLNPS